MARQPTTSPSTWRASRPVARLLYVGLMTGTSIDGVDAAIVDISTGTPPKLIHGVTLPIPAQLRQELHELCSPGANEIDRLGRADVWLGSLLGDCVLTLLERVGLAPSAIAAIGSHGQTIRHRPRAEHGFTLQIGDPTRIAERTGITVVADVRRRDMAARGQGAPLAPAFHAELFRSQLTDRVVVNIGGIANITFLPADPGAPVLGYDTGPGNALMDAWVRRHLGHDYDAEGGWADLGAVSSDLLADMQQEPYFATAPPKSTGRELFNSRWIDNFNLGAISPVDVQRTLLELTAQTIAAEIRLVAPGGAEVILCGGGRRNLALRRCLDLTLGRPTQTTEDYDWDGDHLEAGLCAWIAAMTLTGRAANLPSVTGAAGPRLLGAIFPA